MHQLGLSKINYYGTGADGRYISKYLAWNPGGCGCSGGCDGCWAKAMAGRMGPHCKKCKAFEVHLHEERLCLPSRTNPPGVVLVNFTCDTWDRNRSQTDSHAILTAADQAPRHNYVFLTKNSHALYRHVWNRMSPKEDNWWFGLSLCTQAQTDIHLRRFCDVPGRKWLSLEPMWACFVPGGGLLERISGVIVGHDNRKDAPGTDTLRNIRNTVRRCKEAGTAVFIKQLWIDGVLQKEPEYFPEDLQLRDLPWSMPGVWRIEYKITTKPNGVA